MQRAAGRVGSGLLTRKAQQPATVRSPPPPLVFPGQLARLQPGTAHNKWRPATPVSRRLPRAATGEPGRPSGPIIGSGAELGMGRKTGNGLRSSCAHLHTGFHFASPEPAFLSCYNPPSMRLITLHGLETFFVLSVSIFFFFNFF